jgi:hypothetical protein
MKTSMGALRLLVVVALAMGLAFAARPASRALAVVTNVNASPGSLVYPNTSTVTVNANETSGGSGSITVAVGSGNLTLLTCATGSGSCVPPVVSGNGTSSVTITSAVDGDATNGEPLTLQFRFDPPAVVVAIADPVQACQNSGCDQDSINVYPSYFGSATNISINVPVGTAVCGNSVVVEAFVTSNGVAVPDGTVVVFSANNGLASVATVTTDGAATATIFVPLGVNSLVISATAGGATFSTVVAVSCSIAGPPANIALTITPQTISCGSTASVLARVTDQFGNLVGNDVIVEFGSTLGSITPTAPTIGGLATAVLTSFPQQPGTATITARAGSAVGTGTVSIVCQPQPVAPTAVPPAPAPTAVPSTPGVLPPNTGDGGLK